MDTMPYRLSEKTMARLVLANLYGIDGDRATPNYRYCQKAAPLYDYDRRCREWVQVPRTSGRMEPLVEAADAR